MDNSVLALPAPPQRCGAVLSQPVAPPLSASDRWKAWDDFVEATPDTGFMQSSWWVEFRNCSEFENFGITLKDGNNIVGGAVVLKYSYLEDRCFYYIQDGPVLPGEPLVAEEVFATILEAIKERRKTEPQTVSHLRIEPRWQGLPGFVRGFRSTPESMDGYREPRNTLWIDLRSSEEAILSQMKPKGRYNVRVAQRHGVSVIEDNSEQGLADFLRIYKRTVARQEMRNKPPGYFRTLVPMLSSFQRGSIFFAEYGGVRLATAVVVYFGRRATYFFGGSLVRHREVMAPYLLHFEIMRRAKATGYEWYDLWGVAPQNLPNHRWRDISIFKRKFGGVEIQLAPTLDYVYDMATYERYIAAECEVSGSRGNSLDAVDYTSCAWGAP